MYHHIEFICYIEFFFLLKMAYINIKRKEDLLNLKNKIQGQFLEEKLLDQNIYKDVEKVYKPLIEPLKRIASETSETKTELKQIRNVAKPTSIPAIEAPPERQTINFGPISTRYFQSQLNQKDPTTDFTYGIKWEGDKMKLGRKYITIEDDDIIIDGKKYKGTEGLYELITKSKPENYTSEDKKAYEDIMMIALPFIHEDGTIKANRGDKYKNIMKPLYQNYKRSGISKEVDRMRERRKSFTGSGIQFLPSNSNDLVERHRLLFASLNSGNSSVNIFNELQAINDELLKRGILKSDDIKSISNYFLL